jgi:energy-coupling factor transporter ATP-binding protein EcfA2
VFGVDDKGRARSTYPLSSLEGVKVSYKLDGASGVAVGDVSFEVHCGEKVMLLGPSGCGKPTLLKAAAGFMEPEILAGVSPICFLWELMESRLERRGARLLEGPRQPEPEDRRRKLTTEHRWRGLRKPGFRNPLWCRHEPCCIPSISTSTTSGRENSGGGYSPRASISCSLASEIKTWEEGSWGQVLEETMP